MKFLADAAVETVIGTIAPAPQVQNLVKGTGGEGIGRFFTNIIGLIYIASTIAFVFMISISAWQWITSGGDKESIAKARARITTAVVGIILLSIAFWGIGILGQITGIKFFTGQGNYPPPPAAPPGLPCKQGLEPCK